MDGDTISEEDKAGVLRLGAHDANTIEGKFEVMNYEVTSAAATDLYARTGNDTSKIRGYVGKVCYHLYHDLYSAEQRNRFFAIH
jgi:hypothetical protein